MHKILLLTKNVQLMKAKIFTFILCFAISGAMFGQDLSVLYTPDLAPTIDGIIDENDPWQEDGWTANALYKEGSTEDHSSEFQLLWDDNNIYVAVKIVDATPFNDNATDYQNDCVELFFHLDGGSVEGTEVAYTASTCQLRFQRDESTHGFGGTAAIVTALQAEDDFAYAVVTDEAGWVLEAALPIDALDGGGVFDGVNLMFEIQTADNTGEERTGQAFWQEASDNQWQWVETFSQIALSNDQVQLNTVQSLTQDMAKVWVANDMLNFRNVEGNVSVYSISGALVAKEYVDLDGYIDISSLKSGVYFVTSKQLTAKFVK